MALTVLGEELSARAQAILQSVDEIGDVVIETNENFRCLGRFLDAFERKQRFDPMSMRLRIVRGQHHSLL